MAGCCMFRTIMLDLDMMGVMVSQDEIREK